MSTPELTRVWILEDDSSARFVYERTLAPRYEIRFFGSKRSLIDALNGESLLPSALLVDIWVEDGCFLDVLRGPEQSLIAKYPFIVVSSVDDIDVLRVCFDQGAVDYLVKPFQRSELIVKTERALASIPLRVEESTTSLDLTQKEKQILNIFFRAGAKSVSRDQILKEIWPSTTVAPKTVDVHLTHLRHKIETKGIRSLLRHRKMDSRGAKPRRPSHDRISRNGNDVEKLRASRGTPNRK